MPNRRGCIKDKPDPRDRLFKLSFVQKYMPDWFMPGSVDLTSTLPPVLNQGALSSCVAHGVVEALRYNMINNWHQDMDLSRLQLYYDARVLGNYPDQDVGCTIRDGVKTAANVGVAEERLWPYDPDKVFDKPTQTVYDNAAFHEAVEYQRVENTTKAIKVALTLQRPVLVGVDLFSEFDSDEVAKTGIVPMPNLFEKSDGGHCMLIVGYGQKPGYFTLRNSWGIEWGDKGNCYLPEAYIQHYGSDLWIILTNKGD